MLNINEFEGSDEGRIENSLKWKSRQWFVRRQRFNKEKGKRRRREKKQS